MISKMHRFHGHASLKYVYRHGDTIRGQLCTTKFTSNPKRNEYRLAVVVSKKVHKSAVVRNRIRRRVFEVVRHYESRIKQPYDIVITVFSDTFAVLDHSELDEIIRTQLSQAKII